MIRLVRVELLRIVSRRALKLLLLLMLGVVVLIGVFATRDAVRIEGTADWQFPIRARETADITAGLLTVFAFVAGATYAGADWAAGTVQTLLTWEPRRVRVIVAKVVGLGLFLVMVGVLLQLALAGVCAVATSRGGTFDGIDGDFWGRLLRADARALSLGVLIGWLSFGIASLTRNTGAALGVGFVYLAILENVLRVFAPWSNRFLIGNAIAVWIGGPQQVEDAGKWSFFYTRDLALTVLVGYVVLVVGVMTGMFARRDVT